jgi:ABC-type transporter Mla subunit MlaD
MPPKSVSRPTTPRSKAVSYLQAGAKAIGQVPQCDDWKDMRGPLEESLRDVLLAMPTSLPADGVVVEAMPVDVDALLERVEENERHLHACLRMLAKVRDTLTQEQDQTGEAVQQELHEFLTHLDLESVWKALAGIASEASSTSTLVDEQKANIRAMAAGDEKTAAQVEWKKLKAKAETLQTKLDTDKKTLTAAGLSVADCLQLKAFPRGLPKVAAAPRRAAPGPKPAQRSTDDIRYDEAQKGASEGKGSGQKNPSEGEGSGATADANDSKRKSDEEDRAKAAKELEKRTAQAKRQLETDFESTLREIAKFGDIFEYEADHADETKAALEKLARSAKALMNEPHSLGSAALSTLAGPERMKQLTAENYTWDSIVALSSD